MSLAQFAGNVSDVFKHGNCFAWGTVEAINNVLPVRCCNVFIAIHIEEMADVVVTMVSV